MARAPMQVIVLLYRFTPAKQPEYAIFFRRSPRFGEFWQAISGGGEDDETPLEAAMREANEEGGLSYETEYLPLDMMTKLPAQMASALMSLDILAIPEYAFGANAEGQEIVISDEHLEFRWADYDEAHTLLKFDSNKNALWELHYRLTGENKEVGRG